MKKENNIDEILESEFSEDVLDLKKKLQIITESSSNNKSKLLKLLLPIISIAAVLVLAIIFLPQLFTGASSENIYASYYEPYPMALNQRGDIEPSLNNAISDYTAGRYEEAANKFKLLFSSESDNVFLLYAANAEQARGNYQAAINLYDQILVINDPKIKEQALWYKGLALLKLNNIEIAREIFESMDKNHYKYNDALEILKTR